MMRLRRLLFFSDGGFCSTDSSATSRTPLSFSDSWFNSLLINAGSGICHRGDSAISDCSSRWDSARNGCRERGQIGRADERPLADLRKAMRNQRRCGDRNSLDFRRKACLTQILGEIARFRRQNVVKRENISTELQPSRPLFE